MFSQCTNFFRVYGITTKEKLRIIVLHFFPHYQKSWKSIRERKNNKCFSLYLPLFNLVSSWYREIKHYDCHNLYLLYCYTYLLLIKNVRNVADKIKYEFVNLVMILCRYLRHKENLRSLPFFNCMQNRKATIYVSSLKCWWKNLRFEMKKSYAVRWEDR